MRKLALGIMGAAIVLAGTACSNQNTAAPVTETQATEVQVDETAAGISAEETSEEQTSEEETEAAASAEKEIVIEHSMGTAAVPVNPAKSVVFDMGVLDIINALDIETELAVPTASLTSYLSGYESAVNAGGIKEPNLETIFEFEPEVIFISGRQQDYYEELSKIAPTVYVDLNAETYLDDFTRNVTNVAAIYGKSEAAEKHLSDLQEVIDAAQKKAEASEEKALIILTNDGSISAYGKGSRFGIVHDVLGIKTADEGIDISTHGQEASYEYIAQINPDILFVIDRTAVVGGTQMAGTTLENELVQSTNAAQNDKIVYLDAEIWYLAGGGLTAVETMIEEAAAVLE